MINSNELQRQQKVFIKFVKELDKKHISLFKLICFKEIPNWTDIDQINTNHNKYIKEKINKIPIINKKYYCKGEDD